MHVGIGNTDQKLLKGVSVDVHFRPGALLHSVVQHGRDTVLEAIDQIFVCEDVRLKYSSGIVVFEIISMVEGTKAATLVQPVDKNIECHGVIFGKLEVFGLCLEATGEYSVEELPSFGLGQGLLVNEEFDLVGPNRDSDEAGVEHGDAAHGRQYERPD